MQAGVPALVLGIHVGPALHQRPCHRFVSFHSLNMQRGLPLIVLGILSFERPKKERRENVIENKWQRVFKHVEGLVGNAHGTNNDNPVKER